MKTKTAERRVTFLLVLWLGVFPVLGVVLFCVSSAGYHPAPHVQPAPFSCTSEAASLAVLGSGGSIAPLCGEAAYPEVTP